MSQKTSNLYEKILEIEESMNQRFVERADEIHGLSLATVTGLNLLLLGPPGTAKSNVVTAYQSHYYNTKQFEKLLTKFTTPEEIFGPFSLKALENDEYYRQLDNYLADCHFAFIDETFKSSSALLNSLLTIMNERKFTNGKVTIKVPLLTLVGASNEIPEESDGLTALFDRFHLKYLVHPIQERSNRIKMLTAVTSEITPIITLEELYAIKDEVEKVTISSDIADMYADIIEALAKEGLAATDRTYKMSVKILKAEAYLHGRAEVKEEDLEILQHVLWTNPDERKKVYTLILNLVSPEKNQIMALYEQALEVVDKVKGTTDKTDQMKYSVEAANKLKEIKNKLHEYYKKHKSANKDTTYIKKLEDDVDSKLQDVFEVHLGIKPSSF